MDEGLRFLDFCFRVPGRGQVAVRGQIGAHERVVLRGPSGCGKSTFLKCVAGFWPKLSGKIQLGAADLDTMPPEARSIGFCLQSGALFAHLDVLENIMFGLRFAPKFRDCTRAVRETRAREWLKLAGLSAIERRKVGNLSGGERQRVAVLRALIWEPRLLLLDEPLSAVDPEQRGELEAWMAEWLAVRRIPTLVVSHGGQSDRGLATREVSWQTVGEEQFCVTF